MHMQCEYGNPAQAYPKTNQQLQAALDISELIWQFYNGGRGQKARVKEDARHVPKDLEESGSFLPRGCSRQERWTRHNMAWCNMAQCNMAQHVCCTELLRPARPRGHHRHNAACNLPELEIISALCMGISLCH